MPLRLPMFDPAHVWTQGSGVFGMDRKAHTIVTAAAVKTAAIDPSAAQVFAATMPRVRAALRAKARRLLLAEISPSLTMWKAGIPFVLVAS